MRLGEALNEFGTEVGVHRCDTCGQWFTVCPDDPEKDDDWKNCLAETCDSYDVTRDVDLMFEIEPWRIHKKGSE